jgi:diguanylate cyclase (GGDEF)-like protein
MQSLRYKIVIIGTLLVALTLVAVAVPVLMSAHRQADARIDRSLTARASVYEQLMRSRAKQLRDTVRMLTTDSDFRSAVSSLDTNTVVRALANRSRSIDADIAILMDQDGRVLAGGQNLSSMPLAFPGLVRRADEQGLPRSTINTGGETYEIITVPVGSSPRAAWIAMGFALDDQLARMIGAQTGLDVVLITSGGMDPLILGTTLGGLSADALTNKFTQSSGMSGSMLQITVAGKEYRGIRRSFISESDNATVVLLESVFDAMAPYRKLRLHAIGVSLCALILALVGAITLSRTLLRPIQDLVAAARRMREGNYREPVGIDRHDELGELALAFDAMQEAIAEREERVTYQARFDALTGLPNRLMAVDRLRALLEDVNAAQEPVSLLLIDLDSLNDIAASLGHEIGDALLCQAAERLRASVDAQHVLARLEADEFLIVMERTDLDSARETAEDLLRLLGAGLSVHDVNISVEARIGICAAPEHGRKPDQLLLRAAVAKNDAKAAQQSIHVYQHGRENQHVRQLAILGDLRRATRHDELRLYIQPKISLADGAICGAEALVRWDHPTLGFLPPDDFIPIAEKSGNISLVTHWALTAAVRECRLWLEEGLDIPISVNLSGRDLQNQNLPYFIVEILRDHDLDARYLTLEITEEALVNDFGRARLVLECLRDLGAQISIDDFGTGYSSLAQIRHLPVDELKIDRSFVVELPDNREDAAIVRAAIELAHSLGLQALAEGVETRPAMRWLAEHGCERAQGFFISRPMPVEAFGQWVHTCATKSAPEQDAVAIAAMLTRRRRA